MLETQTIKLPTTNTTEGEKWYHRLAHVLYILLHFPVIFVVQEVWSEYAREYSYYHQMYLGSDFDALVFSFIAIIIYFVVLRTIKMTFKYIFNGIKPKLKNLLYF